MRNRKLDIVTHLRDNIPDDKRESIDQAMVTWWANIRPEGGLRLTRHGYEMLHDVLKIESWELDLSQAERQVFTKRTILEMDRKIEWPYYIEVNARRGRRRVVFFSSREAMMASMYGDLKKWLESIS